MTELGTNVEKAAELLRRGELVAIPTETVYGLAANALSSDAVLKIYAAKGRPAFNPLIVHVRGAAEFSRYAEEVPELVMQLAAHFSPGPLTFVLKKKSNVPDETTGGGNSVALRVPAHPMALDLLHQLDFPLAAPSANPSGFISPVTAAHVADQLGGLIPYVLDGGACSVGLESTVVAVQGDTITVLRLGGVKISDLQLAAPQATVVTSTTPAAASPGQLRSHYAPRTRLVLGNLDKLIQEHRSKKVAVLALADLPPHQNIVAGAKLSPTRNLDEAARNLFASLHRLDAAGAEIILAERMPEEGFGPAINDRLERASV
ncbi:L-threonylcarbamoyladenylate synthase [Turneriella parva]|uniref:Threonylcarbamoyl-AMP synthase n=1 Tax=Turneriella parva (strain ATCC BAA-1111 / DSM 21527 / NCTC 11395 / H) TaxID=869212 RepID=I4B551_TURPD|nr:L-threonylcarbamoyladenylate synthase [Turneriella parva]AFM12408.1 translation factor SUA5 [Turneriella parva DSM 21527]